MAGRKKKKHVLNAQDLIDALGAVTKEKSLTMELVLDSLKEAISSAAKKFLKYPIHVEVSIDREKGTIEAYTLQTVVEDTDDLDQDFDFEREIFLEDAQDIDPDLQIGDEIVEKLDINDFGRSAIQTAKQIITQRVREFERQKIFEDYIDRVGELVNGTVQQVTRGDIIVNLGRTEAVLPHKEQIRKERWRQGDTIKAVILEVKDSIKEPQVIISRTAPEFLERLFEIEVPEIFENIVKVVKIVRAPGYRAKVGVSTTDSRIDPVGACVGMRGNRVQAIVRELANERMDIINWTDDISLLTRRVFSPSEIKRVIEVGRDRLVVIVPEDHLAKAIGKEGQNIKLASRFMDLEIDIYGEEEFEELSDEEREEVLTPTTTTDDLFNEALENASSDSRGDVENPFDTTSNPFSNTDTSFKINETIENPFGDTNSSFNSSRTVENPFSDVSDDDSDTSEDDDTEESNNEADAQ